MKRYVKSRRSHVRNNVIQLFVEQNTLVSFALRKLLRVCST